MRTGGLARYKGVSDNGHAEFTEFFEASWEPCLRAVTAITGSAELAEDQVAEAFARAWAGWRKVSRHPAPQAWVVRAALNAGTSWWRRHNRELPLAGHDLTAPADCDDGLDAALLKINHSAFQGRGQLQVTGQGGKSATLTPGQTAAVGAAIQAQPGTLDYAAETDLLYSGGLGGGGNGNIIEEAGYSSPVTVAVADRPGLPLMVYAYDSITLAVNGKPVTVKIAGVVFLPNQIPTVITSWQTLGPQAAALTANHYDIAVKPGISIQDYTDTPQHAVGSAYAVGAGAR
jgi:hypothetical protein